jgi:hypothetical protein
MTEELPATVKAAMGGADVLVVRRNHQVARSLLADHHQIITALGHRDTIVVDRAQMRITFLSGGRITYLSANSADERVRGMQVDLIDDPAGWLDYRIRALIQKRPTLSNGANS